MEYKDKEWKIGEQVMVSWEAGLWQFLCNHKVDIRQENTGWWCMTVNCIFGWWLNYYFGEKIVDLSTFKCTIMFILSQEVYYLILKYYRYTNHSESRRSHHYLCIVKWSSKCRFWSKRYRQSSEDLESSLTYWRRRVMAPTQYCLEKSVDCRSHSRLQPWYYWGGHDWATPLPAALCIGESSSPLSVAWRIQGQRTLVGCTIYGVTQELVLRLAVDLAAATAVPGCFKYFQQEYFWKLLLHWIIITSYFPPPIQIYLISDRNM